jgi:lipopolysaccharide export system permease protein
MIKTYQKYLIKTFLKKIINVSLIFLSLIIILNVFEEISYFKDVNAKTLFPFMLTLINAPSILFEIFPFIFLISSLLFFLELINKNELEVFKINGLSNIKIIITLFLTSLIVGFFLITIFYHISAKLKFTYLELKNNYSTDDKYLAMVTDNGIWIKDEYNENVYIVSATKIENNYLKNVLITEFNNEFNLMRIIKSPKVNIANYEWIIYSPIISLNNIKDAKITSIKLQTHFNQKKINQLFNDLSSLNIFQLIKLSKDYKNLGYTTTEVRSHLNKIFSLPIYLSIMTVFSGIIMLNIKKNKPMIFYIILSILISVIIYYLNYLFNLLGENGKLPIFISIWGPLFILTILISIGLIKLDEK